MDRSGPALAWKNPASGAGRAGLMLQEKPYRFLLNLSKNIDGIQVFVGEFSDLYPLIKETRIIYKEHPLNKYNGFEESREWMVPVHDRYFGSFFSYWKCIQPFLYALFEEETKNR